ncbi:MAG: PilN domain-containing protein [Nitrospirota bacterium]|nr:PilN domain-containing protein [Nitrospirota bacterium]
MRKILGVSIDARSLNASLIESRFRSARHFKSERTELPENREERNRVIAAALTRWKNESLPAGVVLGLPLQYFSWRTIEMPALKKAEMKKALFFELEKYLPLPVDEYVYDFFIIGTVKTAPNMVKIMVFSIKKDLLNGLLRMVKEAGMEMLAVRCSTIDTLCGVIDVSGEKSLNGIFVNTSDDAYEVAGLYDSMPVYMKRIPKADPGDLAAEIETLAASYPAQLYIAGPVDQAAIAKYDSRKFQFQPLVLRALSAAKKTFLDLNFLPVEFMKMKKDYYPLIIGGLAAAAVVVFFLTGAIIYYKDRHALAVTESQISAIRNRASGVIEAQKKLDVLQSDRTVLLDFRNRSNTAVRVLDTLSKIMPKDAWLISISVDDKGKVEIEGFAVKTADLVVALEKTKYFKNVSFSAPIISRGREERFAIRMEVEGF